jgi:hypothetical protein
MTLRISILIFAFSTISIRPAEDTNVVTSATTNAAPTVSTNVVTNVVEAITPPSESPKDVADFDGFKIITQRNIFDPNRSAPGQRRRSEERPKPIRIDYLNLVGAMSYDKGRFAFFDGNSSEYRKSVKPGDSIAGYKVADVTQNKVTLQSGDKKIDLPVGGQLKREDDGEWRVNNSPESFTGSTSSSAATVSTSSSSTESKTNTSSEEDNPILKRLLEQRKQGK